MKTILIAEDNEANMKLLNDVLEAQGYSIIKCYDGQDAVDKALEQKRDIDLILMDIQLPKLNGLDAIEQIKADEALKKIPIFVISAHAMINDIKKAQAAGCVDYITKPINVVEFLNKVNLYLNPEA